jgi:two-component system phosphate regulon sensor histidine kinase PhoR
VEVEEGLPPILLDPARIDQVVTNLLHNAVKFTPSGGEIAVRVRRCGRAVRLDVRDTGVGIAPEDVDRVFERFFKSDAARHSEGSGLGLAIAKHIVLAHGGQIRVESALGKGSTFTVELPAT